jgi:cobalt-zinc-cadmium resistance protein CzcA
MQRQIEKVLSTFPEVAFVFSKTGTAEMASDPMPPNVSDTFIIVKPRAEWPHPDEPERSPQTHGGGALNPSGQ